MGKKNFYNANISFQNIYKQEKSWFNYINYYNALIS